MKNRKTGEEKKELVEGSRITKRREKEKLIEEKNSWKNLLRKRRVHWRKYEAFFKKNTCRNESNYIQESRKQEKKKTQKKKRTHKRK